MIPKKLHYCWVGGSPISEKGKTCIESWKKFCQDWEIIRWDETNYDFTKIDYMHQAYEAKKWGFVPDYARLDIVASEGGVYLDTDVELVAPLDDLLDYSGYMGLSRDGYVNPGLGFGAEPGNPVIRSLAKFYEDASFVNPDGSLNLVASPHYATDSLFRFGFVESETLQVLDSFALLPWDYLDPLDAATGKMGMTENTVSVHHYFGSWLSERDKYQKELRRSLNAHHIPDSVAWPFSRGVAYIKYEGFANALKRVLRGKK